MAETTPASSSAAVGRETASSSAAVGGEDSQLRLLVERIERLEEEKKGLADDIRDVYAEVKAAGYDAPIVRQIVRLRKMRPADRREMDAILETYRMALGIAS